MTRYMHLREWGSHGDVAAKGGVTIAWDSDEKIAGVAVCSKRDTFSKLRGRTIAEGRMRRAVSMKADPSAPAVLGPGNKDGAVSKYLTQWAERVMPIISERIDA